MKYDTTNGILELYIGQQTRTLVFRRQQMYVLGKRLGQDPISFFAGGGDEGVFLAEAIVAGLSKDAEAKKDKVSPVRVMKWLDELDNDPEFDEDELKKAILYAIARGKPKKEAERMVKLLDESFGEDQEGPLAEGSSASTAGS